jgi:hypothetical protein
MKIRITKKGLPKAQMWNSQPGVELQPNNQPNYNWASFTQQEVPLPRTTIVNPDGTKTTTGNFGEPTIQYKMSEQGTPLDQGEIVPIDQKGNGFMNAFGAASMALKGAISLGNMFTDFYGNRKKIQEARSNQYRDNLNPQATEMFRGNYMTNSGAFQPDKLPTPNEGQFAYGGASTNTQPMKIRIVSGPDKMAYGGQMGYGFDLGGRRVYTDMPEGKMDTVSNTMGPVPRSMANIEAEQGETIYGDLDGDGGMEHMNIGGKRHSQGGTPLNAPEGSFIFSDTKKMKIKDPMILKMFGGGTKSATPAQLAKKYNINKYKAIMEDPNADDLSKSTAQLMVKNYESKLANLALVQESMKGFPQGIPQVAAQMMNPAEMAYGGYIPMAAEGLDVYDIDPYKGGKQKTPTGLSNKFNRSADYLKVWEETIPGISKLPNTEAQRMIYNYILKNNPTVINDMWKQYGLTNKGRQFKDLVGITEKDAKGRPTYKFTKDLSPEQLTQLEKAYVDGYFGVRQLDPLKPAPPVQDPPPVQTTATPKEYFLCTGRSDEGLPTISKQTFNSPEEAKAAGYSASEAEASAKCGLNNIDPDPMGPAVTRKTPFGFMAPDVVNTFAAAAVPPKVYMPFSPNLTFEKGQYALPDWLSQAQQLQQTYNTGADTMGTYGPASALASNLSFLAGQTGNATTQAIANNAQQSVGFFNEFSAKEQDRKDKVNLYNTMNAKDRYDNIVRARQSYDNSRREYLGNIAENFGNAWNNRMNLGLVNITNPLYNISPMSGRSYFTGNGYGTERFGSVGSGAGVSQDSLKKFTAAKAKYEAANMSSANAEKMASAEVFGPSASFADTDMDGSFNSMRATLPYNPYAMGMMQSGFPFTPSRTRRRAR